MSTDIEPTASPSAKNKVPNPNSYTDNLPVLHKSYETLNGLIDSAAARHADLPAIGMVLEQAWSYKQFHNNILSLAAQLQHEGVSKNDKVAILAENSHHWGTTYLAIVRLGAAAVPILPDLPEADVHHILGEMQCKFLFITQRQLEKINELKNKPKTIITFDDYIDPSGLVTTIPFSRYLQDALDRYALSVSNGETRFAEVNGGDIASILYTSGTSGFSKAVMLSHANLYSNAHSADKIISLQPGSVFLSVLPVSHTYEFTVGFLLPLIKGCRIAYAGKTPTPSVLQKFCQKERPHCMLIVPLVIEKIYKKKVVPAIEQSRILSFLCKISLGRKLIHKRIGKQLLDFFGGRVECIGIGGAALSPDVESFLREASFPFLVGYGLTESAPLLAGGPQGDSDIAPGSTGKPVPGVEIRIQDPDPVSGIGEIYGKGPNVMQGYWNDQAATTEALTGDGWLRTGDLGYIDPKGNLHIKGRSKSVIVLANGENIYPEVLEHKLNNYPDVLESLVMEHNSTLEALVVPDYERINEDTVGWDREKRHHYILERLETIRKEVNALSSPTARIAKIVERREPFIKTATHKIKRYLYTAGTVAGENL
ncbi:MAG: AMP-binding protein [Desulfobulbaceae bacterium]|nr:AMP-binding protein [Desulfobulbaceae bacterium]